MKSKRKRKRNLSIKNSKPVAPCIRQEIKTKQGCRCGLCSQKKNPRQLEIHHIKPRCEGGTNEKENLVALCVVCHRSVHRWFNHYRFELFDAWETGFDRRTFVIN